MNYPYQEEIITEEEAKKRELEKLRADNAFLNGKIEGMWEMLKYVKTPHPQRGG